MKKRNFLWALAMLFAIPTMGEDVNAPATQVPISIDGNTTDWSAIAPLTMTVGGTNANFIPTYKATWDKKNLYLLVEIQDSAKVNKGDFWDLDEVEVYIDMDNSKGTEYDKKNDMQIRFVRDSVITSSCLTCNEGGTFPWTNSLLLPGMRYKTKEVTGGWLVEAFMPLDSLQRKSDTKIDFSAGGTFGFNIDVVNKNVLDANGGKAWALNNATADWGKPNTWGTLTMTGTPIDGLVFDAVAKATPTGITIDGAATDWSTIPSQPITVTNKGTDPTFAPTYKTTWDKKNLYMLVQVPDRNKVNKGNFWDLDEVEVYIDMDNSKGTEYDKKNDMQIRFVRDSVITSSCPTCNEAGSFPWTNSLILPGMKYKTQEVTGGWQVEVSMPLDSLQRKSLTQINFATGSKIGFNIDVVNKDSANAVKDSGKAWSLNQYAADWGKPNTWGTLTLAGTPIDGPVFNVVATATPTPITIDGAATDWSTISSQPMTVTNKGTDPTFAPTYKTTWDTKKLYLLVQVPDRNKVNKGNFWDLDEVEVYIDMDNSKGTEYDKKNDMQIRFVRDSVITSSCPTCNEAGSFPWTNSLILPGMVYKTQEVTGGWQVEVSMPLDSLQRKSLTQINFATGSKIGFNIDVVNKDSANAVKDSGKAWSLNQYAADWGKPNTWGTLTLAGTPSNFSATKTIIENKYSIYPNPVKDELFVNNAADIKNISIYSINGSMLNTYNNNAEMIFKLNTSSLKNGLYLLKLTSKNGSVSTIKLMKK